MTKVNSVNVTRKCRPHLPRLIGPMGLLAALVCAGCESSPEVTFSVEGTVKVGGRLMDSGTVVFEMLEVGKSGKRYSARGNIDKDGHYELNTFGFGKVDGAAVGKHRVTVVPSFARAPDRIGVNVMNFTTVPKKYMMPNTSPLVYEVIAGENNIDIEIPLEGDDQ